MDLLQVTSWLGLALLCGLQCVAVVPETPTGETKYKEVFSGSEINLSCSPPRGTYQLSWTGPGGELLTEGVLSTHGGPEYLLDYRRYWDGSYRRYDLRLYPSRDDSGVYTCNMNTTTLETKRYNVTVQANPVCIDRKGNEILHGERYRPVKDEPCLECRCDNGEPGYCTDEPLSKCDWPSCPSFEWSKSVCCQFTCKDVHPDIKTGWNLEDSTLNLTCSVTAGYPKPTRVWSKDGEELPETNESLVIDLSQESDGVYRCFVYGVDPPASQYFGNTKNMYFLNNFGRTTRMKALVFVGSLAVQQVGLRNAIAHVTLPSFYNQESHGNVSFDVHYVNTGRIPNDILAVRRPHAILYDLDPNMDYRLQVFPDLKTVTETPVFTQTARINMEPRPSSGLPLSDALGKLMVSMKGDKYRFVWSGSKVLQLDNYDKVEFSKYRGHPCPQKECGLMSFTTWNSLVMDMIFFDERDLIWAQMLM